MSFTTVYRFQNLKGYEHVISKGNSHMAYMGFGRILLQAGEALVNGGPCLQRGKKLRPGDLVKFAGEELAVGYAD